MQFVIVADDDLTPLGRQLAHAFSMGKTLSGTLWTVKVYKDNETQLQSKMPVIFLGDNEVAKSYADFLPERFHGFGTRCLFEGTKAVLIASESHDVSVEDITSLKQAVEGVLKELRCRAAQSAALSVTGEVGYWLTLKEFEHILKITGNPLYLIFKMIRKREYRKLQYQYVVSRFLMNEFEKFVHGAEDVG